MDLIDNYVKFPCRGFTKYMVKGCKRVISKLVISIGVGPTSHPREYKMTVKLLLLRGLLKYMV